MILLSICLYKLGRLFREGRKGLLALRDPIPQGNLPVSQLSAPESQSLRLVPSVSEGC